MSDKAKCPACGIRQKHEMHYAEDYASVLHTCSRCKAEFGLPPVVPATRWKISRDGRQGPVENPQEVI